MSYVRYIVEGYRLDIVDLSDDSVVALQVPAQNLSTLLGILSKYGILHSSPYRDVHTTVYTVYIPSTYKEKVQDIAKDLVADIGNPVKLDYLSNSIEIIGSMSYRGIRMDLYRSRGWSRASGGKLYNKNVSVALPEIKQLTDGAVEVFKAVKLGYDIINGSYYLFVDARRKLEIVKSID
jgi:fructose 1,6-bisphosphatase